MMAVLKLLFLAVKISSCFYVVPFNDSANTPKMYSCSFALDLLT